MSYQAVQRVKAAGYEYYYFFVHFQIQKSRAEAQSSNRQVICKQISIIW